MKFTCDTREFGLRPIRNEHDANLAMTLANDDELNVVETEDHILWTPPGRLYPIRIDKDIR